MKLFEALPSTNTPINPESLNQIQGNLVIVSSTEPTGDNREKIWVQTGRNRFDASTIVDTDIAGNNYLIRVSSRQVLWLDAGTYTFSTNLSSDYQFSITVNNVYTPPAPVYPTFIYDSYWQSPGTTTKTFTISTAGWFILVIKKADDTSLSLNDISGFDYQLEDGPEASEHKAYINKKIYVKNDNNNYEEFISLEKNNDYTEKFKTKVSFHETQANCSFIKKENVIEIAYQGEAIAHSVNQTIFTLPEGYRPSIDTYVPFVKNTLAFGVILIKTDGTCLVNQISDSSASGRIYFTVTFII